MSIWDGGLGWWCLSLVLRECFLMDFLDTNYEEEAGLRYEYGIDSLTLCPSRGGETESWLRCLLLSLLGRLLLSLSGTSGMLRSLGGLFR